MGVLDVLRRVFRLVCNGLCDALTVEFRDYYFGVSGDDVLILIGFPFEQGFRLVERGGKFFVDYDGSEEPLDEDASEALAELGKALSACGDVLGDVPEAVNTVSAGIGSVLEHIRQKAVEEGLVFEVFRVGGVLVELVGNVNRAVVHFKPSGWYAEYSLGEFGKFYVGDHESLINSEAGLRIDLTKRRAELVWDGDCERLRNMVETIKRLASVAGYLDELYALYELFP